MLRLPILIALLYFALSVSTFNICLPKLVSSIGESSTTATTNLACTTKFGHSSLASVPTTTVIATLWPVEDIRFSVSTPVSIITPSPTTSTSVVSVTVTSTLTEPTPTDVVTSTITIVATVSDTSTNTQTTLVTTDITSTSTSTVTIPTSAGFLFPTFGYNVKRSIPYPRAIQPKAQAGVKYSFSNGQLVCSPTQYPTSVTCREEVQATSTFIVEFAACTTITITAPVPTVVVTSTTTLTVTSTSMPYTVTSTVSTTTDTTTTTDIVVSTTSTSTITNTISATATATFYAACGTANQIDRAANGEQFSATESFGGTTNQVSSPSAYACCVSCLSDADCYAYQFANVGGGFCLTFDSNCGGQIDVNEVTSGGFSTVGNGPCGGANFVVD